jgi:hypothetical protein
VRDRHSRLTVRAVDLDERHDDSYADAPSFALTVQRVQAYVRREPGAWAGLSAAARADPDGTTRALLALGTVLLDIAAGAFRLSPEEVLERVSRSIADSEDDELQQMAQQ